MWASTSSKEDMTTMKTIKRIGLAIGIVALAGVLSLIQGQAQVSGTATWNMGNYIELNVIGGNSLDCDFGRLTTPGPIICATLEEPTCK
jgi:hypothetical protein